MYKKSLLFVESPLQLLNAYEAICYFKLHDYRVIVRLSGQEQNDKQIKNLIKILNINNVNYITIRVKNRKLIDYYHLFINSFKYYFKNVDKVFIGNYDSGFFKLLLKQFKKSKIILLDDGTKTLTIQKQFSENNFYNMFTMYDIKPVGKQTIYKNNYDHIFNMLQKHEIKKREYILFLGMKLSELNIIDEKDYIYFLNKIANFYSNKSIIYIPHRGESINKLKIIEKYISNISIKYLNYPVELYGLYEQEIPASVVSFYSTALLTMKNIYKVEVNSFKFNYNDSIYKDTIDEVYKYYENYMLVKYLKNEAN